MGAPATRAQASQLQNADPALWPVAADWRGEVTDFFRSPAGDQLLAFLRQRIAQGSSVFPPQPLRALQLTARDAVRVVILGQDPYHGRGQAEGLAFSVPPGTSIPPSLRNIFKELLRDLGLPIPSLQLAGGSLQRWAQAGVLLLNTCLTVEEGLAASHKGQGWEPLTDALIRRVAQQERGVVFMLWGAHAQSKRSLIDPARNLVLSANHPSPLSASRGATPFLGCGHFSKANAWLAERSLGGNAGPIPW